MVATLEERMASHAPQPKRARVGGATWLDQAREQRRGAEWGGADRGRWGGELSGTWRCEKVTWGCLLIMD